MGWLPGTGELCLQSRATGMIWAIPLESIARARWEDVVAVVTGGRDPKVLRHVTRITGYYSDLQNWNPSKRQENLDRHRGQYVLPEG